MQKSSQGHEFESLSYAVIGACIDVQRQLGFYCKEEDYQRALAIVFEKRGIQFEREAVIPVLYEGIQITDRRVDFRVWDSDAELLLETKAVKSLQSKDTRQSLMYLEQGRHRLCLLVNFGEMPLGIRRLVNTPEGKVRQVKENADAYITKGVIRVFREFRERYHVVTSLLYSRRAVPGRYHCFGTADPGGSA